MNQQDLHPEGREDFLRESGYIPDARYLVGDGVHTSNAPSIVVAIENEKREAAEMRLQAIAMFMSGVEHMQLYE